MEVPLGDFFACGHALNLQGFRVLNDISWYKPNAAPNLGRRMFTASHETLIWASKSKKARHTFNYDDMREGSFPKDIIKNPGKQMRRERLMMRVKELGS